MVTSQRGLLEDGVPSSWTLRGIRLREIPALVSASL